MVTTNRIRITSLRTFVIACAGEQAWTDLLAALPAAAAAALGAMVALECQEPGESVFPEQLLRRLMDALEGAPPEGSALLDRRIEDAARRWGLTPREREVLDLVVEGQTNKEIAGELGCQEGTVEVHVSRMLKKSGAANRAQLVTRVWKTDGR